MASNIDATHPVTGQPVSKAQTRANWQAAKDEIEALQAAVAEIDGDEGDVASQGVRRRGRR